MSKTGLPPLIFLPFLLYSAPMEGATRVERPRSRGEQEQWRSQCLKLELDVQDIEDEFGSVARFSSFADIARNRLAALRRLLAYVQQDTEFEDQQLIPGIIDSLQRYLDILKANPDIRRLEATTIDGAFPALRLKALR